MFWELKKIVTLKKTQIYMSHLTVKRPGENIVLPVTKMMRVKMCLRKGVEAHLHAVLITSNSHHCVLYEKHSWCIHTMHSDLTESG